jgi:hypothetical protein
MGPVPSGCPSSMQCWRNSRDSLCWSSRSGAGTAGLEPTAGSLRNNSVCRHGGGRIADCKQYSTSYSRSYSRLEVGMGCICRAWS